MSSDGDWKIWVTSDEDLVYGTVALVVYGDRGNSGPIMLGEDGSETSRTNNHNGSGMFRQNNKDTFKVSGE